MTAGRGLAPARTAPHFKTFQIQIILKRYSGKNHMGGTPVGQALPKALPLPGGRGVESCQQHKF
jgi:hypothetical protein